VVLPRIITAVLLVPIIVPIIWVGSFPFFLFVMAIALLSFWEYSNMAESGGYPNQLVMGMAGTFLILMALFLDGATPWGPIHRSPSPLFITMIWTFALFVREFFRPDKGHSVLRIMSTLLGVVLCYRTFNFAARLETRGGRRVPVCGPGSGVFSGAGHLDRGRGRLVCRTRHREE
jgi:CDP-diglyceride synthetase